jgi:hypothetical protein
MTQLMFNDRLRLPLRATLQSLVYGAVATSAPSIWDRAQATRQGEAGGTVLQRPRL